MKLRFQQYLILVAFLASSTLSYGQIYQHNFGTTTISTHPYTVPPATFAANLSASSWVNSSGGWTSFAGSTGQAISLNNSGGTPTITLTFDVASGYQVSVTSFNFWRQRSASGASNWSMTINGISVGSGTVPTTGASIGAAVVSNAIANLSGTITVVMSLSGGSGGTFRLDDFTLNGSVTPSGPTTIANGNWSNPATWTGGIVPTASDALVTVNHAVFLDVPVTRDLASTTIISASASLDISNPYVSDGTTTLNGSAFVKSGITIGGGSTFQVNGDLYLNLGGNFNGGSPTYSAASTLFYSNGITYGRSLEWSALGVGTIGSTVGYPNNVRITGNTTLDYNNGGGTADDKAIAGNLTIDSGSSFYMDYGPNVNDGPLTVGGNVLNSGNLSLGDGIGDDLIVLGNFTSTNNFIPNNRAVVFSKAAGNQTLSSSSPFDYLKFGSSGNRTVQLLTNLTINKEIGFASASDTFDINGYSLTFNTLIPTNQITGSGTFKGSTTSVVNLTGSGTLGTLSFTTGSQVLGSLTVNRSSAAVFCLLGSDLIVNNTLTLTSGIIDLGTHTMTLGSLVPASVSGSASSYVIADATVNGKLQRQIPGPATYLYPIGDKLASNNGSEYSSASINFPAGTFTSASYSLSVDDNKQPNFDGATYITRYWSGSKTGTLPATYTITANYLASDVVGAESVMQSNQWNGTAWLNNGSLGGTNQLTINPNSYPTISHFTKGLRDADINIKVGSVAYLTGSTYNFGTQVTGVNTDITFTIENLGQDNLTFAAATVSGTAYAFNPTPFTLTPGIPGPSGTRTFIIRFTSATAGTFSGSVSFSTNDPTGGENPYVINFTGIVTTPVPEINVKGVINTNPTIFSGDTTPSSLDNTLFAAQNIGTSLAKTFRIENTGTAVLNVPSITLSGANPGDFFVTAATPYSIAAPTGTVDFTITFQPTFTGLRTATVSIANNDLTGSESPYVFAIEGTGNCATSTNVLTPTAGPAGTEITITASSNNLIGASANISGTAAPVTQISPTQITATVPAGAVSGNLVTTNAAGCVGSNLFTVYTNIITSCQGGTPPTKLFISEVTDANTGGLNYVEIYNPTLASINLSGYNLKVSNNGGAYNYTLALNSYNLAPGSTYVVALGNAGTCAVAGGNGSLATGPSPQIVTSGGVNFNPGANDHIGLFNGATLIDSWGIYGNTNWAPTFFGVNGVVFRRKVTAATLPSVTYSNADWDIIDMGPACADNDYSNLGTYEFSRGIPPSITQQPVISGSCKAVTISVAANEGFSGSNPLAYQWYAVAPGAANWTALANSAPYSGVNTAMLQIASSTGLSGYQYYCQVRENLSTCYTASNAVKLGVVPVYTWNGSAWNPAPAPNSASTVIINGNYNTAVNGSFSACSLTVASGILNVGSGNYVSVENDLTVNSGAAMHILNNGSLIMVNDNGTVTNNGVMDMQRTSSPFLKFDYTYWSSPVSNAVLATPFAGWRTDYAFSFNTANFSDLTGPGGTGPADGNDDDGNVWTPASGTLQPGKGYAVMGPTTAPTYPISPGVIFSGTYNNGIIPQTLSLSANNADANDDFNLIGNPYPSALQANEFILANANFSGTLYFWTHKTPISPTGGTFNFINTDYAMYNLVGGVASANGGATPTSNIASGQGFFVDAITATPVIFNNSMRDVVANNTNFYRQSFEPEVSSNKIWINLTHENGLFSQQLLGYIPEATLDFDRGYDGRVSSTGNTVSFYSMLSDGNYRIQGRPAFDASDVVPLGFSTGFASDYSIAIDHSEGIFEDLDQPVYLEDKLLNVIHNLKEGPYLFATDRGEFNNRFRLRYLLPLGTPDVENTSDVILSSRSNWFGVQSAQNIKQIEVFDGLGRSLFKSGSIDTQLFEKSMEGFSNQMILVRIELADGTKITKKARI